MNEQLGFSGMLYRKGWGGKGREWSMRKHERHLREYSYHWNVCEIPRRDPPVPGSYSILIHVLLSLILLLFSKVPYYAHYSTLGHTHCWYLLKFNGFLLPASSTPPPHPSPTDASGNNLTAPSNITCLIIG